MMEIFKDISILYFVRLGLLILLGLPAVWFIAHISKRMVSKKISAHSAMLVSNIIFYLGLAIVTISLLQEFGFNISALLGAAGIVGIALGFAAKTTVANIISGIFLLLERPFMVGDRITCAGNSGFVESIDLMSVKLRTLNGQLVRIPNEMLVSQSLTNISYYPKRRLIFKIEVQPNQDINIIMDFLNNLVSKQPSILKDSQPVIVVTSYSQYATTIMLRFWIKQKDASDIYQQLSANITNFGKENNMWLGFVQE